MEDSDLQELQKDIFVIIIALVIILGFILFYLSLIKTFVFGYNNTLWWIPSILILATCIHSYKLYRVDRFRPGTYVFVGGLTLFLVSFMVAPSTQFPELEIYLLALVVAAAGILIGPKAAAQTAGFAIVTTLGMAVILNGASWESLEPLIAPLIITLVVAVAIWISFDPLIGAISVLLEGHGRAHQRSRKLFESQYELEIAYKMLEQANNALARAQATAVQANEFKTRFVTNLSHELRTPLSAIINLSYILSKGRYGEVTPEQNDYLTRIHDAGNLLLQIVNDLLDLAKIEAGQMKLFREQVDLAVIAANVITTVSGLITDKPVDLRQEIEPNLPKIYGDGTRIRQIMLNLLGNAIKYTDEGSITLRIIRDSADFIRISVIDTGTGIKSEEIEGIFEEFKQTQEAFASRKVGTGLGLPISRKFVELHGGRLWGESEYGKGSAFHFTLPINTEAISHNSNHHQELLQDKVVNL